MRWQKRARLALAIFGIAFAGLVFFAIGEREPPKAATAPARTDPAALLETSRGTLDRITGTREEFTVTFDRQLAYEDGASTLHGVRIDVKERQGRDFVITGSGAVANDRLREITLTGNVTLAASDGFELLTDTASFRESDGLVRAPGPVSFTKGRMSGRGVGMTYDRNADVLTIAEDAHVRLVDDDGAATGEFTARLATLARRDNFLALEGAVHAVRGGQTLQADRARANLTENEEAITSIELRGSARVAGGSAAFDFMSARDIDLDYREDGETVKGVRLSGGAAVVLGGRPRSSAPGSDGAPGRAPGRRMAGESLALALAPDGSVTSATGRDGVQLDLPAGEGIPAREVRARTLDAEGEAGRGMTSARFRDDVQFREEGTPPRTVSSRLLAVALDGDAVRSAVFTGRVRFEEQGLTAAGGEARYEPADGVLRIEGVDEGDAPRVTDQRIAIEADAIEITLQGRGMIASGTVKTRLTASGATPGLLDRGRPAHVSAQRLEYDGGAQRAIYTGAAQLWQGDTAIRAERLTIDQANGRLLASGGARSTLAMDGALSTGRAEDIVYDDASRRISYIGAGPPLAAAAAPGGGTTSARARLSSDQGDVAAARIAVVLAAGESRMDRLEAYESVTVRLGARVASGARLTYYAADQRYVMAGAAAAPVRVVEPCRETTGKTLTFFKSNDRIVVDGNEEIRTRTTSGGACPEPPAGR